MSSGASIKERTDKFKDAPFGLKICWPDGTCISCHERVFCVPFQENTRAHGLSCACKELPGRESKSFPAYLLLCATCDTLQPLCIDCHCRSELNHFDPVWAVRLLAIIPDSCTVAQSLFKPSTSAAMKTSRFRQVNDFCTGGGTGLYGYVRKSSLTEHRSLTNQESITHHRSPTQERSPTQQQSPTQQRSLAHQFFAWVDAQATRV